MSVKKHILVPNKNLRILFLASAVALISGCKERSHSSASSVDQNLDTTQVSVQGITMQDAFKAGIIRSISEYLDKLPQYAEHIDTFVINKNNYKKRICLGKYIETTDSVYLNYFIPDTAGVSPQLKQEIMEFVNYYNSPPIYNGDRAHEWKHYDTMHMLRSKLQKGKLPKNIAFRADVCPEELIKFNQHNEIASRIATVLYQRELYQETGYLSVFSKFAGEYKQAIENGIFNPMHMSVEQSELENRFIAAVISKWWIKHEQPLNPYVNRQKLETWFKKGKKKREKSNPHLYTKILNLTYTFIKDGHLVNMNYFFNDDYLERNVSVQSAEDIIEQAKYPFSLAHPKSFIYNNPPVLGDVTPQQDVLQFVYKLRQMERLRLEKEAYQKKQKSELHAKQQFIKNKQHQIKR